MTRIIIEGVIGSILFSLIISGIVFGLRKIKDKEKSRFPITLFFTLFCISLLLSTPHRIFDYIDTEKEIQKEIENETTTTKRNKEKEEFLQKENINSELDEAIKLLNRHTPIHINDDLYIRKFLFNNNDIIEVDIVVVNPRFAHLIKQNRSLFNENTKNAFCTNEDLNIFIEKDKTIVPKFFNGYDELSRTYVNKKTCSNIQ